MQHYGIPTRTLDWTTNPAVALYFAVQDDATSASSDGALYALNPHRLNFASTGLPVIHLPESGPIEARAWMISEPTFASFMNYLSSYRPGYRAEIEEAFDRNKITRERYMHQARMPVAVIPNMITDRMKAQDARLVIHGGSTASRGLPEEFGPPILLEDSDEPGREPMLTKIPIPSASKGRIRGELARIGIHRARLFPELEHRALHLWERAVAMHPAVLSTPGTRSRISGVTEFEGF
jgi:hypothetical protein